jgi:NAD(P)-dependent dehydrogenase (short-subunit alcohol dehydrogenase family)
MPELADTVAIVTGAAQGIGESIARTLAAVGATFLLADIQEAKVASVAASIRRDGTRIESVAVDIAEPKLSDAMVSAALRRFGRVDVLVNDASIDAPPGLAWEIDEAHWRKIIDVDLSGPWWCIKSVLPHMMDRRAGKVVTISSITARAGSPRYSHAYAAARAGLIGLVVGLSVQLEWFGILVNRITPGTIGTTGTPMTEEEKAAYLNAYPLGFGGSQPVADAVRYLLSPSGNWVSGAIMNVSGGRWRGM